MNRPTIRPLHISDFFQLNDWLSKEKEHEHVTHKDFEGIGRRSLVVEDKDGALIYVRLTKVWRADVQFNNSASKIRIALALKELFRHVMQIGVCGGFRQVIFDTKFPDLAIFMTRLGFRKDPKIMIVDVKGVDNVLRNE